MIKESQSAEYRAQLPASAVVCYPDPSAALLGRHGAALPDRHSHRGSPQTAHALKFVRVEPYVIPKRSLTGDSTERVDTRVLQVIYALDTTDRPIYVGQQVDVFIDASDPEPGPGPAE